VTREKLETIKSCGVNRISIVLQSANEDELKVLGRLHSLDDFERAFSLAREVGFDNISIDIMFALPEQTTEKLLKTIDYVSKFEPEHISSYCLKIESGTPFSKMDLALPNEDTQYEMYLEMCKRLKSLGYEQYEISNFAKNGHRCAHNLKYWLSNEYVGFGPASHSFFGGVRYSFEGDIQKYCSAIQDGGVPKKVLEEVNDPTFEERMDEYVMLRMRLADGVSLDEFKARFGIEFDSVYDTEKYEKSNHIIRKNGTVSFSTEGFFVSNFILSDILKNI
jgi:oxygen-independent coproporphyrinogen-3 oxidase